MFRTSADLTQNSSQMKQDDKFFSRLLSKESSTANPSFRVYYGEVAGAVPFLWESRPGTPKCTFSEITLPPLTPPPSYYSNSNLKPIKKRSRSNLLRILFPKMNLKQRNIAPSSSPTSSSMSSSSSWSVSTLSMVVPITNPLKCRQRGSSFDSRLDHDEDAVFESPTSTLCFGNIGRRGSVSGLRGCYR